MRYHASHSVLCTAPPDRVYELISRSADWPQVFDPCEAVTVLAAEPDFEHIEIRARVGGESMTWQSRRDLLPDVYGVRAEVVRPMKLVAAMTTEWRVVPVNHEQSLLLLEHAYDLCEDVTGQVDSVTTRAEAERFIETAIDTNSTVELRNIKATAERPAAPASQRDGHARHSVVIAAPADTVYPLIRDPGIWPRIFDACVAVTTVDTDDTGELVRIEAVQGDGTVSWDTRRRSYDAIRRVDYHLPVPMPLVSSMHGQWRVVPLGSDHCLLTVDRHWTLLGDVGGIRSEAETTARAAAVRDFVETNAAAEMVALRAYAEQGTDALTTVTTRISVPHPPDAVHALLADVSGWPKFLPHCEGLDLRYDDGRHQEFTLDIRTPAGAETFRSVRHCDEERLSITYFQPEPPELLRRHEGDWQVRAAAGGSEVVSRHTVVLDRAACAKAFGTDDLRAQKQRVRDLLDANSRLTVESCARLLDGTPGTRARHG
ncbi:SRPBCC family protein [Streptomyces sp. V4I2]|uniref:aromatase/cyclase n=1 Tax=Streptomyces sp. V4I2 TaxID=3042280 RepID=UPI0027831463|nr:SRPBCC family protein [Streptomyces sp. V4I2]MDQ1047525.1 ribosome-associated toxin RatA of RatAB toxin-antitoxin module [Streptomyces sp. V4I2]